MCLIYLFQRKFTCLSFQVLTVFNNLLACGLKYIKQPLLFRLIAGTKVSKSFIKFFILYQKTKNKKKQPNAKKKKKTY